MAGANSVNGPSLGTLDPRTGMAEARTAAIRNARAVDYITTLTD